MLKAKKAIACRLHKRWHFSCRYPTSLLTLLGTEAGEDEVNNECYVSHQTKDAGDVVAQWILIFKAGKAHSGAHHAHQGSTSNETAGDECALVHASLVNLLVFAARTNKPADYTANEQWRVELEWNKHTQREWQGRNTKPVEQARKDGTANVEHPCYLNILHHILFPHYQVFLWRFL